MFFTFMLERSATQPVPAQVLYAGGEREGGGVDGGRGGVPQTQTPKGLLSWVRPLGPDHSRVTHITPISLSLSIYFCTKPVSHHHHRPIFDWWEKFPIIISILSAFDSLSSSVRPVSILILILSLRLLHTQSGPTAETLTI